MMRPRILFVSYTSGWTGPTNSLLLLLDGLRENWEADVLLPGRGALTHELESRDLRFHTVKDLTKWSLPRLYRIFRAEPYDLVYANTTHGGCRNAVLAARAAGVPAVCHVREMGWKRSWFSLGYLRLAREVIAVSEATARSVARFVRGEALHVIHNGVPEEFVAKPDSEVRARIRAQIGTSAGALVCISVGHLCPRKAQEYAVDAVARLPERARGTTELWLVGSEDRDPEYVSRVRRRIEAAGLEDRVRVLGFRRDIGALYQAADLALHTAVADPQPRSVIEAMASGLPVVAFDTDGVGETVRSGSSGLLVAIRDVTALARALERMIERPEERSSLSEGARAEVRSRFLASRTTAEVDAVLRRAIAPSDIEPAPAPGPAGTSTRNTVEANER